MRVRVGGGGGGRGVCLLERAAAGTVAPLSGPPSVRPSVRRRRRLAPPRAQQNDVAAPCQRLVHRAGATRTPPTRCSHRWRIHPARARPQALSGRTLFFSRAAGSAPARPPSCDLAAAAAALATDESPSTSLHPRAPSSGARAGPRGALIKVGGGSAFLFGGGTATAAQRGGGGLPLALTAAAAAAAAPPAPSRHVQARHRWLRRGRRQPRRPLRDLVSFFWSFGAVEEGGDWSRAERRRAPGTANALTVRAPFFFFLLTKPAPLSPSLPQHNETPSAPHPAP